NVAHFHRCVVGLGLVTEGLALGRVVVSLEPSSAIGLVGELTDPDELVLLRLNPGAGDADAVLLVNRRDLLVEVTDEFVHLAGVDRVYADLRDCHGDVLPALIRRVETATTVGCSDEVVY